MPENEKEPQEKGCCMRMVEILWQLPFASCIFCVLAFIAFFKLNDYSGTIEDNLDDWFPSLKVKSTMKWGLVGLFVFDCAIVVISFMTSEWFYTTCCDSAMGKCQCCTQLVCFLFNWFLFLGAYAISLVLIAATMIGSVMILYAVINQGICVDTANRESQINAILLSIHNWVCAQSTELTSECSSWPKNIPSNQIAQFCTNMVSISAIGADCFAWLFIGLVAQNAFAIIQRANLVEGAARRGFAKDFKNNENAKEDDANAMTV